MIKAEARRVEDLLLNATQPAQQLQYDGWLLRVAPNDVKRASSINPIYGSSLPLEEKLAHCEHVYADHGLPTLYRMTPFSQPASLDQALEARDYERIEHSLSMTAPLDRTPPETPAGLRFERPDFGRLDEGRGGDSRATAGATGGRAETTVREHATRLAVVAYAGDEAVGCGLVMIEEDYAGLFDITTVETLRGQGIGLATCVYLMRLARQNGAERAWLSVVADNAAAVRLYEGLGFAPVYDYWYRIGEA